jgi:threonine synthase
MNHIHCSECGEQFSLNDKIWRCSCGGVLDINFKSEFCKEKIANRAPNMWRYREAIPIEHDKNIISFNEGFTPLTSLKLKNQSKTVLIKQDHLFNTGSYKDRGASVLISKVKELGINKVTEDSSGNAGSAIAAYCAKAKISCEIYIPEQTSAGKLAQIQAYGGNLHKIPGSREDTAEAVLKATIDNNYYYASHVWNPFFFQGTKTFAYEICEQLQWSIPDTLVLPVGNGTMVLGAYIGFQDLINADIVEKMPKFITVQAANCAPLFEAFENKLSNIPLIETQKTVAEGIAIARPIRGKQILDAITKSDGEIITVKESEIIDSLDKMCKHGFFIEPTAAATIAGLEKYIDRENDEEVIVSAFTGHGLKASNKILNILAK